MKDADIAYVLDTITDEVRRRIPEASFITIGRSKHPQCGASWVVTATVPRRTKTFRIMTNAVEEVHGDGETIEEAIRRCYMSAYFNAHGKFPSDDQEVDSTPL